MNNNIFAQNAKIAATMTVTENGHPVASTTGAAVLDLYGQIGALRNADDDRICELFDRAYAENPLLAVRTVFYGRDARGGCGERKIFRTLLKHMADRGMTDILTKNLNNIPFYGRWDDMYSFVGTSMQELAFVAIYNQLMDDLRNSRVLGPVSLLAKWLKSPNASSKETCKLGRLTAKKLGYSEKQYRQVLAYLREKIRIVEREMSANNWKDIRYEAVPSRAGLIYRDAFKKHDEERYNAYIQAVKNGEKKINTAVNTPQDLVHVYLENGYSVSHIVDETVEAMWKNLPDFVNSDENILCMVDVSGSMRGRPMEISTGLGMYFAQKNRGAFHNLFMTFESEPSFVSIEDDCTMLDNLRTTLRAPWGGSTNLNKAFKEMLRFAKAHNVPESDMPTRMIVISDMEFDEANGCYGYNYMTGRHMSTDLHIDELREMYRNAGYEMPQIIYWNVDSRDNHFHTRSDTEGVMLASGSSPAVFKAVMEIKELDITPYDAMVEVLNGERYSRVVV